MCHLSITHFPELIRDAMLHMMVMCCASLTKQRTNWQKGASICPSSCVCVKMYPCDISCLGLLRAFGQWSFFFLLNQRALRPAACPATRRTRGMGCVDVLNIHRDTFIFFMGLWAIFQMMVALTYISLFPCLVCLIAIDSISPAKKKRGWDPSYFASVHKVLLFSTT